MQRNIFYDAVLCAVTVTAIAILHAAGSFPTVEPIVVGFPKVQELSTPLGTEFCDLAVVSGPACAEREQHVHGVASYLHYQLHDSCATRDWAKGTKLLVSTGENSIVCTVRDFGPALRDRLIDLNYDQFIELAPSRQGLVRVTVSVL